MLPGGGGRAPRRADARPGQRADPRLRRGRALPAELPRHRRREGRNQRVARPLQTSDVDLQTCRSTVLWVWVAGQLLLVSGLSVPLFLSL